MSGPSLEQLSSTAHGVIDTVISRFQNLHLDPFAKVASADQAQSLRRNATPPSSPLDLDTAVSRALDIFSYRVLTDHPRWFAFITSPMSPVSWLGDILTNAFNAHAGGWLQSSGPSAIESELITWLATSLGLPATAGGLFVSGGSLANLTSLTVARDQMLDPEQRSKGVAYVSAQTHSSIAKGLRIIGFLDRQIRKINTDGDFRIDVKALANAVTADRAHGLQPFLVIASCGTTNTGSIDALNEIADLCQEERLWLHVDGAYGASVVLSKSYKHLTSGIGRADSISWDAHKWLFQTYGCGIALMRDRKHLLDTYANSAEYLRDAKSTDEEPNFWNFGPELTRPARGMKLWLTLQVFGTDKIGEMIDNGFRLAETAERRLRTFESWEIVSPASMAIVMFRCRPVDGYRDLDELNTEITRQAISGGVAGVLTTQMAGKTVLRMCTISPATTEAEINDVVDDLDAIAQRVILDQRA